MIKAILFDLGGVLFTDGTKQFIIYLRNELAISEARATGLLSGQLGRSYREGKMTRDEFWKTFRQELNLQTTADELEEKWISGYHLNEGTKLLVQELSRNYDVYYLSNNVQERIDAIEQKYHFLSLFKDGVFSHVVGVRKPNPKIYEIAVRKTGVSPTEIVFTDDKASALAPARAMGMKTILFKELGFVRQQLQAIGVLAD